MATLKDEQKVFIVRHLARFRSPAEVVVEFKNEYGIDIQLQQVVIYDPTRAKFAAGARWKDLFNELREAFIKDVDAIPSAHQGFRVNMLHAMAMEAFKKKNYNQAQSLLKQAAEEVGGVLTNERHMKIDKTDGFRALEPEERRDRIKDIMAEILASDPKQTAPSTTTAQ